MSNIFSKILVKLCKNKKNSNQHTSNIIMKLVCNCKSQAPYLAVFELYLNLKWTETCFKPTKKIKLNIYLSIHVTNITKKKLYNHNI